MNKCPRIGITIGDIGGIGPEIVFKTLANKFPSCEITIYGPAGLLDEKRYDDLVSKLSRPVHYDSSGGSQSAYFWKTVGEVEVSYEVGQPNGINGKIAYDAICSATEDALSGKLDAIVTAPICKESFKMAGITATGHTSLLAEKTQSKRVSMAFYSKKLKTLLVTIHKPLRSVPDLITRESLEIAIKNAFLYAKWLGLTAPRIAMAGLNPHGGENGMFGSEESDIILPVLTSLFSIYPVSGPIPPDTLFYRTLKGEFDIAIALYHDQGLIPLKLIAFDEAVNITVGLPFIRTSPDHGTAFDIVGQQTASHRSFDEALTLAINMVNHNAS